MERVILHCDMNNFYASVECMLRPELKDKAVAVCGRVEERHGIVLAKNYMARDYGVATGDAVWQAKRKCPELVVVEPHYEQYLKFSRLAREIYCRYTDLVEPYGMDECWLDVSLPGRDIEVGRTIADAIRRTVKGELGLTISVGVSFSKVFAKLGSDMKKPDAVTCISRDNFRDIVWRLPAPELLGVGRAAKRVLASCGIYTIGQLAAAPENMLKKRLGVNGLALKRYANGEDASQVKATGWESPVKSIGHGMTTVRDLVCGIEVWRVMLHLVQKVASRLRAHGKLAAAVAISIRNSRLASCERQCRMFPTRSPMLIARAAYQLFERTYSWEEPIRSVTVRALDLIEENAPLQLELFIDAEELEKRERLDCAVEGIRRRFGRYAVINCALLEKENVVQGGIAELVMPTGMLR